MGNKIKPWQKRKPKFQSEQDDRRKRQPQRGGRDRSHQNPADFDEQWAHHVPEEYLED